MTINGIRYAAAVLMASGVIWHTAGELDAGRQPQRHRLDLVAQGRDESLRDERGWLGPPPTADDPLEVLPFAVKLVGADRAVYDLGDDIIYELELTNVSTKNVWMPWLSNSSFITPRTQGAVSMRLTLQFHDPDLGLHVLGLRRTYGAESVPGSLRQVVPGDTVEIRAKASFQLTQAWPRIGDKWIRHVNLQAVASLSRVGRPIQRMPSTNALSIELRGQ